MREDVNEGRAYDETELHAAHTETDSGSLVRRAGARAAVGHLDHHHSVGELAQLLGGRGLPDIKKV